jgi:hypothetical protein
MANKIYPIWKKEVIQGTANASLAGTVKVILVNRDAPGTTYTYSDTHEFLTSVPAGARISISSTLVTKTYTAVAGGATFDADPAVFTAVTGDVCEALIFFLDTGADGTSRLVSYHDATITGLPVTPNGGDINLTIADIWTI